MELKIYKDYEQLSANAANEIADLLKQKPGAVICLASGDTPKLTYQLFAEKVINENIDISNCTFIGLDEWVGIPPENEGSCQYFFRKYLFEPLQVTPGQTYLFNALSSSLEEECKKMDETILAKGGIDLMMVGIGMNGHIGFNEPGVSFDLYSHIVNLDETTVTVGQKYFNSQTALQKGITLGLKHFMESKKAIVLANGAKKAGIIKKALEDEISNHVPATIIRTHAQGVVMIDEEAASLLK